MIASDLGVRIVESGQDSGDVDTYLELQNVGTEDIGKNWRLYFSLGLTPGDTTLVSQTLIDGRYGYIEPTDHWQALAPGELVQIPVDSWLFSGMALVDRQGFYLSVVDKQERETILGSPTLIEPELAPLTGIRNSWIADMTPGVRTSASPPPEKVDGSVTVIPAPKSAEFTGRWVSLDDVSIKTVINDTHTGNYDLNVNNDQVTIIARNEHCVFQAKQTLTQITRASDNHLPLCSITDTPDFAYRSLFLDISRHFHHVAQLKKVIDAMALYKLNTLQLGFSNDEGWRLEIPELPELTDVGAKRSHEGPIYPSWGDGPEEVGGLLTRDEFIELLQYAAERHITIVPEFNLPGHANALLRSFDQSNRYELVDPDDRSEYRSAQGYARNVLNVGLEDSYRLAADIIREIAAMYAEAGLPFTYIHLGGDEVPQGAWLHSPACHALPVWEDAWDLDNPDDQIAATKALMQYHYARMLEVVREVSPQTQTLFWHDMAPYGDDRAWYNVWLTDKGDRTALDHILARGYTFIISNASHLYLDMPYAMAADEPGLPWANYIDTRDIFEFDPLASWELDDSAKVLGIQAQLWSETVFDSDLMDYYLFPRLLAVAERAWNATPDISNWPYFYSALADKELARLKALDIKPRPLDPSL